MENSKKGTLPFRHGVHLSKEQSPKTLEQKELMSRIPFVLAVGSLMFAMLCTRSDICYTVGVYLCFFYNKTKVLLYFMSLILIQYEVFFILLCTLIFCV